MTMTDAKAEKMRQELEAFEAEKAKAAREEQNAKRAESLAVVAPVAELLNSKLAGLVDEIEATAQTLPVEEWDLANLLRNIVITSRSAIARAQRRVDDNQPAPAEDATPAV